MIILPKPHALLLDWDNTLVDSWPIIHESLTYTFEQMGHTPWTLDETKERVHKSMRDAFPALFGDEWEKAADIYRTYFRTHHLDRLAPLDGAEAFLNTLLYDYDMHIAIVSNKTGDSLRKEIAQLDWGHFFGFVVGATDVAQDKPSAMPLEHALSNTDHVLDEYCWMIGDSLTDMEAAANGKCTAILYGDADPTSDKFSHCVPHAHAPDYAHILSLIEKAHQ